MNKEKKLIPELRFPEFKNDGQWELEQFSKYIKLFRGSSPRPIKDFLTKDKNGVNWIKIGDTKSVTNFRIKEVEEKISIEGAKKSRKVKKGELILANSMSYGKTYQLALDGCIYDGWFVLREYENFYDKEFLLQLLNSSYIQQQYEKNAAGGIVQNISSEIVYRTFLPQTSIPEQQKIASCLSSLDELIQAHVQKLEILKDHKKGLMQNLFPQEGEKVPKFRFPEFENDGEWEFSKLGKIGEPLMCKRILKEQTTTNPANGVPFYKIGTFGREADAFIPIDLYKEFKNKYSFPNKGDILISASGTIGRLVVYDGSPAYFQDSNIIWLGNNEELIINKLLLYCYSIVTWQTSDGGIIKRLYNSDFRNIEIPYPKNKKEQEKIASTLSSLDNLIITQSKKVEQLKEHKKGLMQSLFPNLNK